jgi:hypothetical protein
MESLIMWIMLILGVLQSEPFESLWAAWFGG